MSLGSTPIAQNGWLGSSTRMPVPPTTKWPIRTGGPSLSWVSVSRDNEPSHTAVHCSSFLSARQSGNVDSRTDSGAENFISVTGMVLSAPTHLSWWKNGSENVFSGATNEVLINRVGSERRRGPPASA